MGRRRSSLEEQLHDILQDTDSLRERTDSLRQEQKLQLAKTEEIIERCNDMASMGEVGGVVVAALKWKRKLKPEEIQAQKAQEEEENVRKQEADRQRAEIMADLARLQGMVTHAKQSSAMQMLHQMWTRILRGKRAEFVLRWQQKVFGAEIALGGESGLPGDGYVCEMDPIPAEPTTLQEDAASVGLKGAEALAGGGKGGMKVRIQ